MKSALGCASFGWQAQSAKPKCPANLASTRTREGGRIEAAQPRRRTSCQPPALSLPSAHAANCSTASLAVSCVSSAHAWNRKTIGLRDNLPIDSSRTGRCSQLAAHSSSQRPHPPAVASCHQGRINASGFHAARTFISLAGFGSALAAADLWSRDNAAPPA